MAGSDKVVFQGHHVIEQQAAEKSRLIQFLIKNKLFDPDSDRNLLNLPADRQLAALLDVTPHNGGPLGQYSDGLNQQLDGLADSPDGQAALHNRDLQAAQRIAGAAIAHRYAQLHAAAGWS